MLHNPHVQLQKKGAAACCGMIQYQSKDLVSPDVYWSRNATSSSKIAYLIPRLHLHFYLSNPLPNIVIVFSPLHDFHVLMDSSVSVLNSFLNSNWWTTYLYFIAKGRQGLRLWYIFGVWKLVIGKHGSIREI